MKDLMHTLSIIASMVLMLVGMYTLIDGRLDSMDRRLVQIETDLTSLMADVAYLEGYLGVDRAAVAGAETPEDVLVIGRDRKQPEEATAEDAPEADE